MLGKSKIFLFGEGPDVAKASRIKKKNLFEKSTSAGWLSRGNLLSRDREKPNALYRTFALSFVDATFRVRVEPGRYRIRFVFGDTKFDNHRTVVRIPAEFYESPVIAGKREEFHTLDVSVETDQPYIDIEFSSPEDNWIINMMIVRPEVEARRPRLRSRLIASNYWKLPPEVDGGPAALLRRYLQAEPPLATAPTGLAAADYLKAVAGIVGHFRTLQDASGAIIDPVKQVEWQYSTPYYAYAAGLCGTVGGDQDLVDSAALAFDWAAHSLNAREAPNQHEDFYPMALAQAFRLLSQHVAPERRGRWAALLRYDPFAVYRARCGGADGAGANWNCKALAGEYLLIDSGLREDSTFCVISLLRQGRYFQNMFGLYAERPMVYDIFPRAWLSLMLEAGYHDRAAGDLAEALHRGTVTSLFMQSPTGAIPCGGRSSHHQWPDAMQCIVFEIAAKHALADGDAILAGIYKRAARRALAETLRWQRPTGEFQVVKNRFEPARRHGYENYSSHSQYNLLLAAALGFAYTMALDSEGVAEVLTPAEHGAHVVDLPAPFDKVIASAGGARVVVVKRGEARQTPAGLVRAHFDGVPSSLPFSDGLVPNNAYRLPRGPRAFLSAGLTWRDADEMRSVASYSESLQEFAVSDVLAAEGRAEFTVTYAIPEAGFSLAETYVLQRDRIAVTYRVPDGLAEVALCWPVFLGDGRSEAAIRNEGDRLAVTFQGATVSFAAEGCGPIRLGDTRYPHRNGFVTTASAPVLGEAEAPRLVIRREAAGG